MRLTEIRNLKTAKYMPLCLSSFSFPLYFALITFSICLIFQLIFNLLMAHSLNIFYSLQAA